MNAMHYTLILSTCVSCALLHSAIINVVLVIDHVLKQLYGEPRNQTCDFIKIKLTNGMKSEWWKHILLNPPHTLGLLDNIGCDTRPAVF